MNKGRITKMLNIINQMGNAQKNGQVQARRTTKDVTKTYMAQKGREALGRRKWLHYITIHINQEMAYTYLL